MTRLLFLASALIAIPLFAADTSPYAGEESRAIKSLSDKEVAALRRGDGMGFAKLAELNHYPGPRHVLAVSSELGLSATQLADTQALYQAMRREAISLGDKLLAAEYALDRAFGDGEVSDVSLQDALLEIGRLRAQLRNVHLQAHLEQKSILSAAQVAHYDTLRGYASSGNTSKPESHTHQD